MEKQNHPDPTLKGKRFDLSKYKNRITNRSHAKPIEIKANYSEYQQPMNDQKELKAYRHYAIYQFNRLKREEATRIEKVEPTRTSFDKNPLQKQIEWENFIAGNFRCVLSQDVLEKREFENVLKAGREIYRFLQNNAKAPPPAPWEVKYHFMKKCSE